MKIIISLILTTPFAFASTLKTVKIENGMRVTRLEQRSDLVPSGGITGHTYFITKSAMREHDELDCDATMAKVFQDLYPEDIRSAFFGMLMMSCFAPIDLNDTRKSMFEMVYVFEAFNEEEVPALEIYLKRISNFKLLKIPAPPVKMRWLHVPRTLHLYENAVSRQEPEHLGLGDGDEYYQSLTEFYYRNLKISSYVMSSTAAQEVFDFLQNLFRTSDRDNLKSRFQKSRYLGFNNWAGGFTDEKYEYYRLWNSTFSFGPGEVFRDCAVSGNEFCL